MSLSSIGSYGVGYDNLSSGYKINTAADNPAGLAISEGLKSQSNGYDVGTDNAKTGQDLLNTADGALSSITDSLQRIRELSVQASNSAIYSSDDIQAMQDEVNQLKNQIQDTAKGTEFNTKKLLDGSMADMNLATNPSGKGMQINLTNSTLESLGIDDYDLTGDFDISEIDDAIKKVSDARSSNGAANNTLSYTVDNNNYTSYNLTSSQSKIADLDMEKSISEEKKSQVMQQYQYFMQKNIAENQLNKANLLV
jgi:flagellin